MVSYPNVLFQAHWLVKFVQALLWLSDYFNCDCHFLQCQWWWKFISFKICFLLISASSTYGADTFSFTIRSILEQSSLHYLPQGFALTLYAFDNSSHTYEDFHSRLQQFTVSKWNPTRNTWKDIGHTNIPNQTIYELSKWRRFDITRNILRNSNRIDSNIILKINDNVYQHSNDFIWTFLLLQIPANEEAAVRRSKRSADSATGITTECADGMDTTESCCTHKISVSIDDTNNALLSKGMAELIWVSPENFDLTVCKGRCGGSKYYKGLSA